MKANPLARLRPAGLAALALLLLAGCATYGDIANRPGAVAGAARYTLGSHPTGGRSDDVTLLLAFSGGGTRAAALAYGVLEELRDTVVRIDGRPHRLLDEVDVISAVSGGSFTAAYYGLRGDAMFADFEPAFLRRDIGGELVHSVFNPATWFSKRARTETAVEFYEDSVFKGATFGDLQRQPGPLIVINASDLGGGVRFSFLQEYFDLLCSDLSAFPVARAVTASSAVPVLFNPVVLENYPGCRPSGEGWLDAAEQAAQRSPQMAQVVDGLKSYQDKDRRRYIHLVDGGITDNLGLRALYDFTEIAGGAQALLFRLGRQPAARVVVISVNAATDTASALEQSNQTPSIEQTVAAVTDVQLHLYNAATLELVQDGLRRWSAALSTPQRPVSAYLVDVGFDSIATPARRQFFNDIPTSFTLTAEQVDALIAAGRELLRGNAEYRRFLADLDGPRPPP
ncbi:patatin-like phospholipase family protein [Parasulfuritortus cantonensis]|uniref:Patatin-like phospholipase family protein n=1 Tax=Parasulfuritortus cantonensis TaxID=2528202 RepID=A0A4R1B1K6_9PROT|nr:patatin-like phospholipase family protein [Parasulfuritortus cantonensis]TCJ11671.1 patatin-like phospholipase family protein [Parasulfuritortus cantonensis]